jgi:hypothetical protein
MTGSAMTRRGRWLAIGALAILVASCGSAPATSAPASLAASAASSDSVPSASAPTDATPSDDAASASPSEGGSIDRLQPFIPADIWSTCEVTVLLQFATTVQSATCTYPGVDTVTYQLFANPADLKASFDSIVAATLAKPSSDMATACAAGNWSGTWNRTGKAVIPANGLECDIDSRGAWIVQADPNVNVLFQANLASGDGAALHTWWLKNVSVVEPGT